MIVAAPLRHALPSLALAALVASFAGCSSENGAPGSTGDADDATSDASDAAADGESSADAPHNCPGCQATKCSAELKACGGSSTCVDWLVCMNECFKKPDVAACQTLCRTTMDAPAKTLDACTAANCHTDCAP